MTSEAAVPATRETALIDAVPKRLAIDGGWREATGGGTLAVEDPSTGEVLCEVADATPEDGAAALAAAHAAQPGWAATPPRERGEILRRTFEAVTARADEIALLITLEMGKPLAEARAEVAYGAEFIRWYAEEAVRVNGRYQTSPSGDGRILTVRKPIGPCLLITPWNFPLAMGTRKIAPALAAGCTTVVKPASQTPLTMLLLAEIMGECGVPDGVVNVITTSRSGAVMGPLISDPRARKLSFTGSTPVGQRLLAQAAEQVLRTSMELGGNAPFLVFADADLDAAVDGAVIAKMRNGGESCVAANRFLVAEEVAEAFAQRLAARLATMRVGRGTEDGVDVGPLIDEPAREGVHELVADAVGRGARALTGGHPVDGRGYFYAPTVLTDVPADADLLTTEIFGPVAPITTFTDEAEAVASANATEYGLAAYVYTRDLARALRTVEALEVGMVGLNRGIVSNAAAPFGGAKQSGLGREGGPEGLEEYLQTTYVAVDLPS